MRRPPAAVLALATALALPAQNPEPLLQRLPAGATNLLVVRDLKPHVEAVLRSPLVRELTTATRDLQRALDLEVDPRSIARQLDLLWPFVPKQIVAATDAATVTSMARAVHAVTATYLLHHARTAGQGKEELGKLREEVVGALRQVTAWRGLVRIEVRDERLAEQWLERLRTALIGLGDDGLRVQPTDARLEVTLRPFALRGGAVAGVLRQLGIDPKPFADLALTARLQQTGTSVVLQLGEFETADLDAKTLGPLWRSAEDQAVFVRLDWGEALDVALESYDLLAAADVAEFDDTSGMQLLALLDSLTDAAPRVSGALDLRDGLTWTIEGDLGEEIGELERPAPELVRCLDPEAGPFVFSSLTLDFVLSVGFDEVLRRMQQRANRPGMRAAYEALETGCAELIEYLGDEESAVFESGCVLMCRAAQFRGCRLQGAAAGEAALTLGPMPFAGFALVAKTETAAAGRGFVDRITELLGSSAGIDVAKAWVDADLGFRAPTRRLEWQKLAGRALDGLTLDADFDPHHVQRGGLLVLATDPNLTRSLLARLDGKAAATLPQQAAIAWQLWRGEHLGAVFSGLQRWNEELERRGVKVGGATSPVRLSATLAAFAAFFRTLDRIETVSEVDGSVLREVMRVRLRESPPKK